jgi:hypothetical protein
VTIMFVAGALGRRKTSKKGGRRVGQVLERGGKAKQESCFA